MRGSRGGRFADPRWSCTIGTDLNTACSSTACMEMHIRMKHASGLLCAESDGTWWLPR